MAKISEILLKLDVEFNDWKAEIVNNKTGRQARWHREYPQWSGALPRSAGASHPSVNQWHQQPDQSAIR